MPTITNVSLDVLRTLHRIHRQLSDLKERQERAPKQIRAAEANVKFREEEVTRVREELKTIRKTGDQKQLQLKSNEEKIKTLRTKLNQAASNREYQILKDQIAADEMANSVLEDEIIEVMEQADVFAPKVGEVEGNLKASKEKSASVRTDIENQQSQLRSEIERLEGELKACELELPPPIREIYLRMAKQKGEDALAVVIDQSCGGCNQQVPLNIIAQITMSQPSFCLSCGRLLYLPENTAPSRAD